LRLRLVRAGAEPLGLGEGPLRPFQRRGAVAAPERQPAHLLIEVGALDVLDAVEEGQPRSQPAQRRLALASIPVEPRGLAATPSLGGPVARRLRQLADRREA